MPTQDENGKQSANLSEVFRQLKVLSDAVRVQHQKDNSPSLSEEEMRWVKLAIKKEAQAIKFRQAVIEKTLLGLIWALVVAVGYGFKEVLVAHGWKP